MSAMKSKTKREQQEKRRKRYEEEAVVPTAFGSEYDFYYRSEIRRIEDLPIIEALDDDLLSQRRHRGLNKQQEKLERL